ncbi:nuclear transport factor 2 family protein [Massilia sp. YMA4]|uniref:nuclear transport factor 2 family protein n=1 Tax=Massilia sp. YMA4 TaxID=1593482 RepID=UPI0018789423|nr:nuclear transport factor 2 family protein [Massilia sp. YMA4]
MLRLIAVALLSAVLHLPTARAQDNPQAVAEINAVVQAFQAAIVARDQAGLEALFLPADNSWLVVASEARWVEGRPRVRASNYRDFARFVGTTKAKVEERFYNVRIFSNGSIGTVYFDFDFVENDKVTNKGSESWHLVKTEQGWKISSMVFSLG